MISMMGQKTLDHSTPTGYLKVDFGYRLSEGTVVVNAQPLEMTIN
jgi:hypothetical protein